MDFILNLIPLNVMLVNRKERKILLQHLQVICTSSLPLVTVYVADK